MEKINRRSALLAAGAALAGVVAGTASESEAAGGLLGRLRFGQRSNQPASPVPAPAPQQPTPAGLRFNNEDFYTDGKFNVDKAKDAIIELCRYFKYPVFPDLKERLWVSDYGTGKFTELGLACIGIVNHDKDDLGQTFMMQDLFLLPNQMLPEHWHIKGDGIAVKNEGWFIRYGKSFIVGIGDDNLPPEIKIPDSLRDMQQAADDKSRLHMPMPARGFIDETGRVHSYPEFRNAGYPAEWDEQIVWRFGDGDDAILSSMRVPSSIADDFEHGKSLDPTNTSFANEAQKALQVWNRRRR